MSILLQCLQNIISKTREFFIYEEVDHELPLKGMQYVISESSLVSQLDCFATNETSRLDQSSVRTEVYLAESYIQDFAILLYRMRQFGISLDDYGMQDVYIVALHQLVKKLYVIRSVKSLKSISINTLRPEMETVVTKLIMVYANRLFSVTATHDLLSCFGMSDSSLGSEIRLTVWRYEILRTLLNVYVPNSIPHELALGKMMFAYMRQKTVSKSLHVTV